VQHRRIIKRGPVVFAAQEDGSLDPSSPSTQGLFFADTRYLSTFRMLLNGLQPILMGSSEEILFESSFIFTNPQLSGVPERALGILQRNTIEADAVDIVLTTVNWSLAPVEFEVSIDVDCDFFDSFEARGVKRLKRGDLKRPRFEDDCVRLEYIGLDGVVRTTTIAVTPKMNRFADGRMYFDISLKAGKRTSLQLNIKLAQHAAAGSSTARGPLVSSSPKPPWFDSCTTLVTSNASVNAVIRRSIDDLEVLMTEFPDDWVPAAGLPRFAVPFGRDSLITGLQTLMWNPRIARGVLRFLAKRQGVTESEFNYEQPGKIMHELHTGELAHLKAVPFGLFYGSVDSTVLFLVLGGEYIRWTDDLDLYHELKDNFDRAWEWVDKYGDIDGSGYVQYKAHTPPRVSTAALTVGLFNQGWKDSATAVVYANGKMCTDHPVSLAEVQGDLYRALHLWAGIYVAMPPSLGTAERGRRLFQRAHRLKEQFNHEFWMPEKGYYAMALDGHHRQVDSITSNPAQCLWARLIDADKVELMVKTLMSQPMFTSWGVRTMANTEAAYNPFSYHDGSIWPFENSIIASGLKKYGLVIETQQVFDALMDASLYFEYRRWPEVYAGIDRSVGGVIARQPDASRPQAWSAGAVFLFMQTVLGIATQPFSRRVDITPALPSSIDEITVDNIAIAGGRLGLRLVRQNNAVLMEVRDNPNDLDITIHPATPDHAHLHGERMPAVSG
jgi:glycogen debranching enzyme